MTSSLKSGDEADWIQMPSPSSSGMHITCEAILRTSGLLVACEVAHLATGLLMTCGVAQLASSLLLACKAPCQPLAYSWLARLAC